VQKEKSQKSQKKKSKSQIKLSEYQEEEDNFDRNKIEREFKKKKITAATN